MSCSVYAWGLAGWQESSLFWEFNSLFGNEFDLFQEFHQIREIHVFHSLCGTDWSSGGEKKTVLRIFSFAYSIIIVVVVAVVVITIISFVVLLNCLSQPMGFTFFFPSPPHPTAGARSE